MRDSPGFSGLVEGTFGLLFAGALAFGVTLGGAVWSLQLLVYERRTVPIQWGIAAVAAWLLVTALEWFSVRFYVTGLREVPGTRPLPLSMRIALSQRRSAVILRPFVSFWWLANAAALIAFVHSTIASFGFVNPDLTARIVRSSCSLFLLFGSAYASNTYLLLAVTALSGSESLLWSVWRVRILIDLAVAGGLSFVIG